MNDDLDLRDAFRAARERYDGEHPEPDATLTRALFRTRALHRKRRVTRWVLLPAAAALVASTAWAGVTGRLAPAVRAIAETFHTERDEPPAPAPPPVSAAPAPAPPPAETAPAPEPEAAPEPAPSTAPPVARSAVRATVPAPAASRPDPHAALFAEAHRIHFTEKDPARALAAWDRYLEAAPEGRFAPEARYNRALALIRLGRKDEARRELAAFADGRYGAYRRDDARALLDALPAE